MSTDMTPADRLNHQVVYTMLNKVKHSGDHPHDVSFFAEDFEGESVSRELLIEQLNRIMPDYLLGEIEHSSNSPSTGAALVTCKNAQVTTDGLAMLKADYFKIDHPE